MGLTLAAPQAARGSAPMLRRIAVSARGRADGAFRADVDPFDVHMAITALWMFTSRTSSPSAPSSSGRWAKGDMPGRRRQVADIVLSWLKPESVCQSRS